MMKTIQNPRERNPRKSVKSVKNPLNLWSLLLLLGPAGARAQTAVPVSGRVADGQDQSPLIGANVLLIHLPDSVRSGVAADAQGAFQFDNVMPGRYLLDASFVGYQRLRRALTVGSEPLRLGTLGLAAGGVQLKNVVVTAEAKLAQQKGDTTQFNARAFKTNPDATAGDLLQKMPGVTVGTDGKVQAQGETVQQVLVDGKPFFGTDPDAVLKNLPADAIDKIEVFDQRSEQSRFSGFDDGNTTKTINVVTKAAYRNGSFGRVVGGVGPQGAHDAALTDAARYRLNGNLNNFHGDQRISVLAQSNNVNEQNFGTDDLLGVVGNSNRGGNGRGGGGPGGGGSSAGNFLVNQSGGITKTNALGLNYSNTWNKKTELTGSYFFNRADNRVLSNTQRAYVTAAGSTYNQDANTGSLNTNHRFNLRLEHQLDSANSLLFTPRLSYQLNDGTSTLRGLTARGGVAQSQINTDYAAKYQGVNTGGNLLLRHRFRRAGRTASLNVSGGYNNKNGNSDLLTTNTGSSAANLNQHSDLKQYGGNVGANLAYTEPLSKTDQLQGNVNLNYAPNNSEKYTLDYADADRRTSRLDTALSNVFQNYYLTQAGGLSWRHVTPKYQASVGVAGQYSELMSTAQFPRVGTGNYTFVNLLPQAMLNYRFSRQRNLRIFYRTNTNPPSISQLQAVVNNSNPLQLTIGNPNLRQEYGHSAVLRYSASNLAASSNFFALLAGSYTQNPIANRTLVAARDTTVTPEGAGPVTLPAGGQITQPVNLSQAYNLRTQASYGRPITALKTNVNLNLNASYTQNPGIVNGGLNYARTPAVGAGVVLSSNISPRLDFTLSTTATQSYVRNTLQTRLNSSYYAQVSRLRLGWIVGPGINIQTDLTHQAYSGLSAGYNQQYILWNASLGKKVFPGQRGEIKLYAFDILGQNRSIQRNVTEAYYEDVRTTILQRYFMLMFTYNIRSGNVQVPTAPAEGHGGRGEGRGRRGGFGPDGPGGGGAPGGGGPPPGGA